MSIFRGISSVRGLGSFGSVGAAPPVPLVDEATLVSVQSSGEINLTVRTTTGYAKVEYWNGSTPYGGSGDPGTSVDFSLNIVSPYNNTNPKTMVVYSCTSTGSRSGNVTFFYAYSLYTPNTENFTSCNLLGCSMLQSLYIRGLTGSLDLSNLTSLLTVGCQKSNFGTASSINLSGCSALFDLNVSGDFGSSLASYITGWSELPLLNLTVTYNPSLVSLDLTDKSSLQFINCGSCSNLDTVDISYLYDLISAKFDDNSSLASVTALGVGSAMYYPWYSYWTLGAGISVKNCNLNAAALDQLYSDLAESQAGQLFVHNNPGVGSDDPTIATAKNYTVYGS
jgi:hypothetical protein